MAQKIQLTVEDSLSFAADRAYWDGFSAGVNAASEYAKRLILDKLAARQIAPPAQQEPTNDA